MENPNDKKADTTAQQPVQNAKAPVKKVVKKKVSGYGYGNYGGYGGYGGYGYGGNYGGYGGYGNAGYGYYGSYGGSANQAQETPVANRTMKDYMMILRERFWYIVVTFFVIFAGILLYTFRLTPMYTSVASVQILRDTDSPIDGPGSEQRSRNNAVISMEDFNTQVKLLESFEVIKAVKSRLKENEIKQLMAPYYDMFTFGPQKTEEEVLGENRKIVPERLSLMVRIVYTHPEPAMAAKLANLFATEYINFTHQNRVQKLMASIDELRTKVSQQEAKVKDLDKKLVEYRKANGAVSLDALDDVDRNELRDLNSIVTSDKRMLDSIASQWKLIQEYQREKKPLTDLHFIAEIPQVSKLLTDKSTQQVYIATLEKRYKEKHPRMIEARKGLDQIDKELESAIASAYEKTKASYDNARKNYETSLGHLNAKKEAILALGQKAIVYKSLERERQVAESLHSNLIAAMNVRTAQVSLINEGANIIDRAGISPRPSSPNYVLNIILGIVAGIGGGIGMAFLVAFLDDRTKSAHDVESVIGLPLLGIIPRVKRLNSSEKAQVAASNADRATTEAFRSLHSTLKVNSMSRNAKVILSTSTTPSEGKSFVVTNLALTCALHGEKVLIIDADLRLPAMAKTLGITENKGVVSLLEDGMAPEEAIIKNFFPNLDVLICEKRPRNPTQMLNSEEFAAMIERFRGEYDRIFIDSPPIGAVSDAISLLPSVDGIIYVIKFNTVRRKAIRGYVRRLMESNVPVLGAIINMVNPGNLSMYNMNYYDKSYQNYYTTPPEIEEEEIESNDSQDIIEEK